jgi:hypothetical protein
MKNSISIFRLRTKTKEIQLYVLPADFRSIRVGTVQLRSGRHLLCAGINIKKSLTLPMETTVHA